eukprot:1747962-Rhodomonas_salina.3
MARVRVCTREVSAAHRSMRYSTTRRAAYAISVLRVSQHTLRAYCAMTVQHVQQHTLWQYSTCSSIGYGSTDLSRGGVEHHVG